MEKKIEDMIVIDTKFEKINYQLLFYKIFLYIISN